MVNDKRKPVDSITCGRVQGAIWANQVEDRTVFRATFSVLYVGENGQWSSGTSFSRRELLELAETARLIHARVQELEQQQRRLSQVAGKPEEDLSEKAEITPKKRQSKVHKPEQPIG